MLTNDTDQNGDELTAVLVTNPANGSVILNADGSFTYTPNPDFTGADSFTYQANDGQLDSAVATVHLNVIEFGQNTLLFQGWCRHRRQQRFQYAVIAADGSRAVIQSLATNFAPSRAVNWNLYKSTSTSPPPPCRRRS